MLIIQYSILYSFVPDKLKAVSKADKKGGQQQRFVAVIAVLMTYFIDDGGENVILTTIM